MFFCRSYIVLLERNNPFALPECHPYKKLNFHPALLILKGILALGLGNKPVNAIYIEGLDFDDVFSAELITYIYFLFAEYFASDGETTFTGSKSKYVHIKVL